MQMCLLAALLAGVTQADETRPFVRITHPTDGVALAPDTDFEVNGVLDHQTITDASQFQVRLRLYQAVANRLTLVKQTTTGISRIASDKSRYSFRAKLHQPPGAGECVLRVDVLETAIPKPKWVARDFLTIRPRPRDALPPAAVGAVAQPKVVDRRVLILTYHDHERYEGFSNMAGWGYVHLHGQPVNVRWLARIRLHRVQQGKLVVFQEWAVPFEPDGHRDAVRYGHNLPPPPMRIRPPGAYLLRVDVIDPQKPDTSVFRDATVLEVVPREKPERPQAMVRPRGENREVIASEHARLC